MKSAVILIAFFVMGCWAELDPKCAWGESHWCSSLRMAKSCGAVDHCKTTLWKNEVLNQDGTEVCQFCQSVIGDVRRFLEEKKTQDQVAHFMSTACGVIPKQAVADECKYVVEFMMDEIIQLVTAEVSPQMICSLLKICSGMSDTVQHSPIQSQQNTNQVVIKKFSPLVGVKSEPICTDCKKFFTDIKNMITGNATEAQVEQLIDDAVCSLLGSLESECKTLVHQFVPELMQVLASYYDPNLICQSIGVCDQTLKEAKNYLLFARLRNIPLYQAAKTSSAETCSICEVVMGELQALDRNKDVQTKVMTLIKTELCARLGSSKDMCNTAVELYAPELFELLATELDPTTRCRSLGFCTSFVAVFKSVPMLEIHPGKPASPSVGASVQCILCEYVIGELKTLIGTNATEAEVIAAVDKVCNILPKTVADSCRSFIDTYGPAIIKLLISDLDPDQICTEIGLCDSSATKKSPITPALPAVVGDAETCAVCETIVQYLEALLEQNATTAEVEAALQKICGYLPESMTKQCNDIVQQYGLLIIHYISTMASPEKVCTLVGVCTQRSAALKMATLLPARQGEVKEEEIVTKKVPLLGQNECTWGPAYWCASRENADKCNAVDHCKRTVWKQ